MKRDLIRIYIIEILLIVILSLALFVSNVFDKKILALVLVLISALVCYLVKKKKPLSIFDRQVTLLMIGFGIIYIIIFYLMGYYKSTSTFSFYTIYHFILPFVAIIISSELLRKRLLMQNGKASKILTFISMVLIDLVIYTGVYDVTKLDDMLTVLGFILFASISCNLLYNYITIRYGSKSVIIYRMITVLYAYFIPYIPDVYLFFRSFLRIIYPYIIYLILEWTYSKTNYATAYNDRKKNILSITTVLIVMSLIIALISCRFRYGIIVVGSGSMTGSINKGDAVVFEQYHNEPLKEGEVIIFKNINVDTVHRIVSIENINGVYRYYTKGDANQENDDGYRTKEDIKGIIRLKIPYIGYPTLWVRDIFD